MCVLCLFVKGACCLLVDSAFAKLEAKHLGQVDIDLVRTDNDAIDDVTKLVEDKVIDLTEYRAVMLQVRNQVLKRYLQIHAFIIIIIYFVKRKININLFS